MAKSVGFNIVLSVNGQDVIVNCKRGINDLGRALGTIPGKVQETRNAMMSLSVAANIFQNTYSGIQQITSVMTTYIQKANAAAESQVKLTTIMRQRMDASQGEVDAVNRVIAKQMELGVVGGTVQRSGLQQLATFASQKSTLETLLPAMNNLLVQQKGLNATSEDAVGIGNLMGKVLQGQTSALKRVGITFTDAEASTLKYGNEQERAATLAQVITNNVGNMNAEMAKTDAGKVKQMSNEFAGLETRMGQFLSQYQSTIMVVGQVGMAVTGINSIITGMRALATATGLTTLVVNGAKAAWAQFSAMSTLFTAAINGTTLSVTQLRTAIRGTILSMGLVGIAYMAVSKIAESLTGKIEELGTATDNANSKMSATERLTNAAKEASEAISSTFTDETNRIKSLKEIIDSNNSSLADKKTAIEQLKSIIPGFNATISKEGTVHYQAADAIAEHINALNALQRAMAAYQVGADIEKELATKSFDYSKSHKQLETDNKNFEALSKEFQDNKGGKYMYKVYDGLNAFHYERTAEGDELLKRIEDARQKLKTQLTETTNKYRDLQSTQSSYDQLGSWRQSWINEGAKTTQERSLRQRAYNSVVLAGGQQDKAASLMFGRSENALSQEEMGLGSKSKHISDMQIGEVEDEMKKVREKMSDKSLSKKEADRLGAYYKDLAARDKTLRQKYGMATTPKEHTPKTKHETYKTETQQIDDQLKKLKDKYVSASDDTRDDLSAKIQQLERKRAEIELKYREAERPGKVVNMESADKELAYLEALRNTAEKKDIPAIDQLVYNVELFKLSLRRPEKFRYLTDFDNEIAYQQKLLERTSSGNVKNINKVIDALETQRDAMKNGYEIGSSDDLQSRIQRKQSQSGKTSNADERKRLQNEIKDLQRQLSLTNDYEAGSAADLSSRIQSLTNDLENVNLSEAERNKLLKDRIALQRSLDGMQAVHDANDVDMSASADKDNTDYDSLLERLNKRRADLLKNVRPSMSVSMPSVDIAKGETTDYKLDFSVDGMDDLTEVARLIDTVRKRKSKLDKEATKKGLLEQYGGDMVATQQNITGLVKSFQLCGSTAETVGSAIAFAGQQLQQIGGQSAAAKAGAIAAALGQLALGYAYATSDAGKQLGPWGWIAFGLAGMAQLLTMINTISSFATGGIVPGTSYTGDRVVAHVNSGEMILNARQQARLFAIASGNLTPALPAIASRTVAPDITVNTSDVSGGGMVGGGNVVLKVKGRDLVGVIDNDGKIGRKIGRHTVKMM